MSRAVLRHTQHWETHRLGLSIPVTEDMSSFRSLWLQGEGLVPSDTGGLSLRQTLFCDLPFLGVGNPINCDKSLPSRGFTAAVYTYFHFFIRKRSLHYSHLSGTLHTFPFLFPLEYCTADTKSQGRKIQTSIFNPNKVA